VDGQVSAELKLTGKPAPDIFLEAAKRLGGKPEESCVIEDAVSGVEAGSRGGFRYVIGVDRLNQADRLREHGADMVVNDLVDLERKQLTSWLPSAPERVKELLKRLTDRQRVFFLDYDGTLTPIVERPEQAVLSGEMRQTLTHLASTETVAIVSGRDLQDVRERVNIENLFYAGSHGFDILGPDGVKFEHDRATDALPALDKAESALRKKLQGISGAEVERKRFSIAIHYRRVEETEVPLVADAVKQVGGAHTVLRTGTGKKVFELQPDVEWNKGKALLWMMNTLGLKPDRSLAVYIGDDTTDEDAFEVLAEDGIGIVVHSGSPKLTFAEYVLADTEEVRQLLEQLSKRLKGDRS
jgi:alpha,alpha-trehalase